MSSDKTLQELNKSKFNKGFIDEFLRVSFDKAKDCIVSHIDSLRYPSGRRVRIESRDNMIKIYNVLYQYVNFDNESEHYGECTPSMRTIASNLDQTLELPSESDSLEEKTRKERLLAPMLMRVHRTIKTLCKFGIIKIHEYRAETNRNDDPMNRNFKLPNFYYELAPIGTLSKVFAEILSRLESTVMGKLCNAVQSVKECVSHMEKFIKKTADGPYQRLTRKKSNERYTYHLST